MRCDDSVTRVVDGVELPVRRSRGLRPAADRLPFECPRPILAVGGQLKATFALGRGRQAFLSHHMGDLDHYEAYRAFVKDVELYEQLFGDPAGVHGPRPAPGLRHDALRAGARGSGQASRLLAVQHHHAHMASCMAEHGLAGPVIGVTFDGTGYGTDGAVWGGEFLVGDYREFRRAAHLRYVGMPGGEQADPRALADGGGPPRWTPGWRSQALQARLLPRRIQLRSCECWSGGFNTPLTSSAGRLFDAVAAIGGRARPRQLRRAGGDGAGVAGRRASRRTGAIRSTSDSLPRRTAESTLIVDTRPLIRAVGRRMP